LELIKGGRLIGWVIFLKTMSNKRSHHILGEGNQGTAKQMVTDGIVFLLGVTEMIHEFLGTLGRENITIGTKMKDRSGGRRKKGIGLNGCPVGVDWRKYMRKSRTIGRQYTSQIKKVGIGGNVGFGLSPPCSPSLRKSDIVL
jgi:hypothetical protein